MKKIRIDRVFSETFILYDFIAKRYFFLLLLFLLEVSTDRGSFVPRRGRDSIWKKTGRLHKSSESVEKTCEEIKSVNPRRNFPPDSTSVGSIPQHPHLFLYFIFLTFSLFLSLSLFPLRSFDSMRGRTTESRQQSEKRAAAKDTHRYAI